MKQLSPQFVIGDFGDEHPNQRFTLSKQSDEPFGDGTIPHIARMA